MIISYSDTLLIRFQTDNMTSLRGFALAFMAVEPPEDDSTEDNDLTTPFPGYVKSSYHPEPSVLPDYGSYDMDDEDDDDDEDDEDNDMDDSIYYQN